MVRILLISFVDRCSEKLSSGSVHYLLLLLLALPAPLCAETVSLPMRIDFPLLRTLIAHQAYPEPGERAAVVRQVPGCNEVWLAKPGVQEEKGRIRFTTDISLTWGLAVGESCLAPVNWQGSLVFFQEPRISDDWRLQLETKKSQLLDSEGERAVIPGLIWDLVKDDVHGYIASIGIDLAPPVTGLKKLLDPGGDHRLTPAGTRFLASMRPGEVHVDRAGMALGILADVDEVESMAERPVAPPPPEQQEQVLALWRSWDALLVRMLEQFSPEGLTEEERRLLLDILLEARYEFSGVIGTPKLTTNFVRHQFMSAWHSLKPLFIRHLQQQPRDNLLGYLSFFTSANALVTIDRIGPLLGIDLSRDGFYRMASMLGETTLDESDRVDERLRELLGLEGVIPGAPDDDANNGESDTSTGGESPESAPAAGEQPGKRPFFPVPNSELVPGKEASLLWPSVRQLFSCGVVLAAEQKTVDLSPWTGGLTPATELLPKVRGLLDDASRTNNKRFDGVAGESGWGELMLMTTAWQESCFRQFIVKDSRITYLLSYNKTSVGIMQVNEKVWRGIYDLHELRWNPEYNVRAGSEILALYLKRYIARHKSFTPITGQKTRRYLAGWLYALYNGGPSQLRKYPRRKAAGKLYKVDRAFAEKFVVVERGAWEEKVDCLPKG